MEKLYANVKFILSRGSLKRFPAACISLAYFLKAIGGAGTRNIDMQLFMENKSDFLHSTLHAKNASEAQPKSS